MKSWSTCLRNWLSWRISAERSKISGHWTRNNSKTKRRRSGSTRRTTSTSTTSEIARRLSIWKYRKILNFASTCSRLCTFSRLWMRRRKLPSPISKWWLRSIGKFHNSYQSSTNDITIMIEKISLWSLYFCLTLLLFECGRLLRWHWYLYVVDQNVALLQPELETNSYWLFNKLRRIQKFVVFDLFLTCPLAFIARIQHRI